LEDAENKSLKIAKNGLELYISKYKEFTDLTTQTCKKRDG